MTSGAGYHTANVAEHPGPNSLPAESSFVNVMANLATATSADRETVATLTKAVATLTAQLKVKDILAKSQEAELKRLLGAHANATPVVPIAESTAYVRKSYKTKNDNYCWSHGYQVGFTHTSANCTTKAPCHKNAATKNNIMGVTLGAENSFDKMGKFRQIILVVKTL
jgi:hypothetical protein